MQSHNGRAGTSFREILAAWVICSALYLLIALAPLATSPSKQAEAPPQEASGSLARDTRYHSPQGLAAPPNRTRRGEGAKALQKVQAKGTTHIGPDQPR